MAEQLFGIVLIVFSYGLLIAIKNSRSRGSVFLSLFMILTIYHSAAIYNGFWGELPGTDKDSLRFHRNGVEWAANGEWQFVFSAPLFDQCLGLVYRMLGPTKFIGCELSVIITLLACVALAGFPNQFGISGPRIPEILVLFALLPGAIICFSTTMREPFLVFFFVLGIRHALRWIETMRPRDLLIGISSLACSAVLHKTFLVYFLFVLTYVFVFLSYRCRGLRPGKMPLRIFVAVGMMGVAGMIFFLVSATDMLPQGADVLKTVVEGDLESAGSAVDAKLAVGARADYRHAVDFSSPLAILKTVPMSFLYYMQAPFPWQVRNVFDLYGAVLAIFRAVLIFFAIRAWSRSRGLIRFRAGALLCIYFTLSILWAAGTTNYGTAARHHLTHDWIVILLGWSAFVRFVSGAFFGGRLKKRRTGPQEGGSEREQRGTPVSDRSTGKSI